MSGIEAKQLVKYVVMPGVMPRVRSLFGSGFGYIAFLIAHVYAMVRLLPNGHPYLDQKNIGRFGLRHVVAAAADNLILDKKHLDQLFIFFVMLLGIVLLAIQIITFVLVLLFGSSVALAAGWPYVGATSYFVTGSPENDVAFMLLDRVFGVPDFFNSCVADTSIFCVDTLGNNIPGTDAAFPWPFHVALHQFFRFYSTGMLLIATIIFLYYIVIVVVETATTGSPFGQRFQNVWAPVRLVVALGLLVPLPINYAGGVTTAAYNSGQYIVFAAAKYGSSLATNAWITFNNGIYAKMEGDSAGDGDFVNPTGEKQTLLAFVKPPNMAHSIVEAMGRVHVCDVARHHFFNKGGWGETSNPLPEESADVTEWLDRSGSSIYDDYANTRAFMLKTRADWMPATEPTSMELTDSVTYQEALEFFNYGDIVITFGHFKDNVVPSDLTQMKKEEFVPACGEIRIPVTDKRDSDGSVGAYSMSTVPFLGAVAIQQYYFTIVRGEWTSSPRVASYLDFATRFVLMNDAKDISGLSLCDIGCTYPSASTFGDFDCTAPCTEKLKSTWRIKMSESLTTLMHTYTQLIWETYTADSELFAMDAAVLDRGWGGAGLWFNNIGHINGDWVTAVNALPAMIEFPIAMQKTVEMKKKMEKYPIGNEIFNPEVNIESAEKVKGVEYGLNEKQIAKILYEYQHYWYGDVKNLESMDDAYNGDIVKATVDLLFGTEGLLDPRDNIETHPLAYLTALGRGLVDAAIRNITISAGASVGGGLGYLFSKTGASVAGSVSGFFNSISFMGLTAGLVLYYVVPFLPFVYFYFAVASWIKTIFEAMVGVPLWALAHLRISGDGLPGESASNGYFLILEVMIRPILTVAGLIAAFVIFGAQVRILNFTWGLVIDNAGGYTNDSILLGTPTNPLLKRKPVDALFFTIIYAIVVYMMATASFKLVDTIPDNILRWAGQGVSSFGDINQDPTGELTRTVAMGGMTAGREVASSAQQFGSGIGGAAGSLFKPRWDSKGNPT